MKRIIALLLALVCVVGLVACRDDEPSTGDDALAEFRSAIAAADPVSAGIDVVVSSTVFNETLSGSYDVFYNADGSATVEYSYEQLAIIDENTQVGDSTKETLVGVASVAADGTVTVIEGVGGVGAQITAVAGVKLNLDGSKMTYTASAGALTATVKAQDTASVLGVAISADVSLVVTVANGTVSAITISYSTAEATSKIVCLYYYE